MITLQNIQIAISGLKILPIKGYYDLTSADSDYSTQPNTQPEHGNRGITFKADAIVKGIK